MEKKFAVVHDLGVLSEEQRKQYLRDASAYFGLDPDLNALDAIWMNNDDGLRRLTAYARRGTTDMLRGIHGITVSSLEQYDGPGYVSFKATGKNKQERQEIAVGAHATEGLKGERLAAAVATAQTRALRRLTLQFVGGGILDESEIATSTTNIASQSTPLSQLALAAQPTVAPSNAPGKDITTIKSSEDPQTQAQVAAVVAIRDSEAKPNIKGVVEALTGQIWKTQEDFEAHQAKLRADAIVQLNQKDSVAQNPPKEGVSLQEIAPKKTRKPRSPNKPKVNLGPSEPVPTQTAPIPPPAQPVIAPEPPPVPVTIPVAVSVSQSAPQSISAPPIVSSAPIKPRLTPDQVKPFRQRLFRLVNDQLEPNGFMPKEGMGNADKMRSFATMMFPEVANMNELTIEQWEKYLTVLENKVNTEGPVVTVKYIEDTIGI